ncbi:hypothetical protein ACIQYZ_33915, partial [Rhodococcus erythropolis]
APTSVEATPQSPPPPIAPERRPTEPRVSDASDGDDNATGRHRPDDAGAISVSELIARQKRS